MNVNFAAATSRGGLVGQLEAKIYEQRLVYTFRSDHTAEFQISPELPKSSATNSVNTKTHPATLTVQFKKQIFNFIWEITSAGDLRLEERQPDQGFAANATLAHRL